MSNKLRSVNTRFWQDPFVEELAPSEKLLFLYLITNPLTNMLGVYEISPKRIAYDTGLSKEMVSKALKAFEKLEKVFFVDGFIVLANFFKNQRLNTNMFKGAVDIFNELPNSLKNFVLAKDLKGFERLLKASKDFEKYEVEIEVEVESEDEKEGKKRKQGKHLFSNSPYFDFDFFKSSLPEKYLDFDLEYYYEAAKGYSASKGAMYVDWLAAIENWIRRDEKEGKAARVSEGLSPEEQKAERDKRIKKVYEKLNKNANQ